MNEDRHTSIIAALAWPDGSMNAAHAAVPGATEHELIDAIRTEALRRIDSASAERVKALLRDFIEDGWPYEHNLEVMYALDPSPVK
jgi:hypothetical protein